MLTPKDLENVARRSGYNYVAAHDGGNNALPYYAQSGTGRTHGNTDGQGAGRWRGPRRETALEAAWDYCNFAAGQHFIPTASISAGHQYDVPEYEMDDEERAAWGTIKDKRAQRQGKQGYIYVMREADHAGFSIVKVGYSTNPWKRVAELQTGNPRILKLVCMKKGTVAEERSLLRKYAAQQVLQEWYMVTTELLLEFDLDADGVPYVERSAAAA